MIVIKREFVVSGWFGQETYYVATQKWSYIHTAHKKNRELYRTLEDPGETCNLIDKYPGVADKLEGYLRGFLNKLHVSP